jgi:hypothetical protein
MSDFANMLTKRAKETNRVSVQGVSEGSKAVDKAESKEEMASMFAKHKAATAKTRDTLNSEVIASAPKQQFLDITTPANGLIKAWSMSRLHNYETCPHTLKQRSIDKIKTPDSPQAARGTQIHDMCEQWVKRGSDDLKGDRGTNMDYFRSDFEKLRSDYDKDKVELEGDWGYRRDWSPCGFFAPDVWGRAKLDAFVMESPTSCKIIDYKTGRKYMNEIKHGEQGLSYALATFHRYPDVEHFCVEFWYLDQGEKMIRNFRRSDLAVLLVRLNNRAVKLTSDTELTATPSEKACKWCDFGSNTNKAGKPYGISVCEFDYYKGYEIL